jgi:hypothetical protein
MSAEIADLNVDSQMDENADDPNNQASKSLLS